MILTLIFTHVSALHPYYFVIHWSSSIENEIVFDSTPKSSLFNEIFRIECENDDGNLDLESIKEFICGLDGNFTIFVDKKFVGVSYSCQTDNNNNNNFKDFVEELGSCYLGKYITKDELMDILNRHIFPDFSNSVKMLDNFSSVT